jgi:hypothetical protein
MPKISINMEHSLSQAVALERLKGLLNKLKSEFGNMISDLKESWDGNGAEFSFRAMGMSVEGEISVGDNTFKLDGKIPLAALPFKSKIEKAILDETTKLLK